MSVHLSFSLSASLLPGERVLLVKRWVWGGSVSSLPTYRWIFSIPPLCEVSIYMTDRRVLWHGYILRLVSQEFSQWFGDSGDGRDDERVLSVSEGRMPALGPYVEIVSASERKRWWRSKLLRCRVFTRRPREIATVIAGLIRTPPAESAAVADEGSVGARGVAVSKVEFA